MMKRLWVWFLARFHLNDAAVCRLSERLPPCGDYHDYQDDIVGSPVHFHEMTCRRCGKRFYI